MCAFLLWYHGKQMAVASGMMNSMEGKPIKMMKNLGTCGDCHTFSRLVAKTEDKIIIIRNPNLFDHFLDGVCHMEITGNNRGGSV